jgi:uncharacterized protein YecT (DUF1311 family)
MNVSTCRLVAFAAFLLLPPAVRGADDYNAAYSLAPSVLNLCSGDANSMMKADACRQGGFDKTAAEIDRAFEAALAKAPANVQPLLKRDLGFFRELISSAAEDMPTSEKPEERAKFSEMLSQRLAALGRIAEGFGRSGVLGKWENAFGNVTLTPAENGAYRLAIDINAVYGPAAFEERQWHCQATALLKPGANGWLEGALAAEDAKPDGKALDSDGKPLTPPFVKLRGQGATLRVVVDDSVWDNWPDESHAHCKDPEVLTGSYFASGKAETAASADKIETSFVTPTFDCAHPYSASDEEICADPELAENDVRLNRAWKALLPRLDEATRRALSEDQRQWVKTQTAQYMEFVHPAWNKTNSYMHFTSNARGELNGLQRERIALLEGFDDKRKGLAGVWLSYTAILEVTPTQNGGLKAHGWKWDQGDWKAGCHFDMEGTLVKGSFRSSEDRTNPDTLERDGAMLIVNRGDDAFAKKRKDGNDDDPKCYRNLHNSSTVRLFPAKASPDINNYDHIR